MDNNAQQKIDSAYEIASSAASGSPKGVYDTLEDLESDDPEHGSIYICSDSGHWYYWNGSAWSDGGVYQANGIADDFYLTSKDINRSNLQYPSGYYYNNRNVKVGDTYDLVDNLTTIDDTNQSYKLFAGYINVNKGDKITFYNAIEDWRPVYILILDTNDKILKMLNISNSRNKSETIEQNGRVVLTGKVNNDVELIAKKISNINLESINDNIKESYYMNKSVQKINGGEFVILPKDVERTSLQYPSNYYYNTSSVVVGDIFDVNNPSPYNAVVDFILFAGYIDVNIGDKITFRNAVNESLASKILILDINNVVVKTLDISSSRNKTETITQDGRVILTGRISSGVSSTIVSLSKNINLFDIDTKCKEIKKIKEDIKKLNETDNDYIKYFMKKVICIGDSVTEGHVMDYPRLSAVDRNVSYPTKLSQMTDWTIENGGLAGISILGWWTDKFPLYNFANYEMAIIELGYNGGLGGSIADHVDPYDDYHDYADTPVGDYCKIIEGIKDENPNIFIVLVISSQFDVNYQRVIKLIAQKYNLPIIDLTDETLINLNAEKYHGKRYETSTSIDMIHFNALGYLAKAKLIYENLKKIMLKNDKVLNDLKTY